MYGKTPFLPLKLLLPATTDGSWPVGLQKESRSGFSKIHVPGGGYLEVGTQPNRCNQTHQTGSGRDAMTINPEQRTYHLEAFRFPADATDGNPDNQFPGWPLTIHQVENRVE